LQGANIWYIAEVEVSMVHRTWGWIFVGAAFCLVARLTVARPPGGNSPNWHEDVFFGIHYDLHANAGDTELGRELTPEHLRERLRRVRPDWVQTDCKGHPGYTSWPTKVGSTSPGVRQDALRIYRDVTRELGIRLGVHYSGIWDDRAVELHPEWARVDAKGERDRRTICRLSDYLDQLMIPQMREIIDTYDVDGFWVDGENWAAKPCWCERCRAEFTRRTGLATVPLEKSQANWDAWLAFHRELFLEHVRRYTEAVHARKPGCLVVSNWMYTLRQPEAIAAPIDYLSGDFSHSWGGDAAAIEGRVMDSRQKSWDLMAWGFTRADRLGGSPGWLGPFKPAVHLQQEISEVLALGGAVMVYEVPQRSGWLTGWHNEVLAEVGEFCRLREETCFKSKTVPQAAVLHLAEHYYAHNEPLYNFGDAVQPIQGALQALLETHRSTDVLTEDAALARMNEYKLVVVPELTRLSARIVQGLEDFARGGGYVLMSGAHLTRDYPALVGALPRGDAVHDPTYLAVGQRAVGVSGPWQPVTPVPGSEVMARRLSEQEPEKDKTDQAIVTRRPLGKGAIIAVHGPVFRDYYLGHYPLLRQFIGELVHGLGIAWKVTVEAPPHLEMVLRQKDGRLLVNLIHRGAGETLSAQRVIVEELPPVKDVVVRIRQERRPKAVSVVPADQKLDWTYEGGIVTVRLPQVEIHRVLVVE
jgi:alpha-L-fucosidase